MSRRRPISLISVPLFETSNGPLWGFIRLLLHERPPQTDALFSHKRAWTSTVFPHSRRALSCFQTDGASQPSPHASLPSQTGSHYRGSQPHHRWPFNTSLATANEPGVAAAWLDPADFAQMFISHSPAVLGWEVLSNPGSVLPLYLFIYLFSICLSRGADTLNPARRVLRGRYHFLFCFLLSLAPCRTNTI